MYGYARGCKGTCESGRREASGEGDGAWYCPYDESELERLHGAKAHSGAGTCTLPCCRSIAIAATTMAKTRLEKTQKAADGKRPVAYSVVITFSCK